jgi:Winged helix DNA-binding domain
VKADALTRRQLNRATLARQMLLARERVPVVAAVERLAGMQAQEPKPPFVGLWSRLEGFTREDLHGALHDRTIVRATMMRGTLHLMSAGDYAALRACLQPVMDGARRALGDRAKGLELDELLPVARGLLRERPRDFNQLRGLLVKAFPHVNDRALGFMVRNHLPLAMVPTGDRWAFPPTAEFTLAEEWLGEPLSRDGTPDALVLAYLAAFGPATAADFQTWSGLRGTREVLDRLRPRLRAFRDERGLELFDLPEAPRPDGDVPAPARFLPDFDNLVLAHSDRTRVLADEHRGRVTTRNLRVRATFLWDGFAAGTWSVERRRDTATLRISPFELLPDAAAAELTREAEALLRFTEADAGSFLVKLGAPGST